MFRQLVVALLILVALNIPVSANAAYSIPQIQPTLSSLPYSITHSNITINVGLIGFSNSTIRADSLPALLPQTLSPGLQQSQLSYGVIFKVKYTMTVFGESVNRSLRHFVSSAIMVKSAPTYLVQQLGPDNSRYAIVSAETLQDWLHANAAQFNVTNTHYTILVANLTGISNYDHYYEETYREADSSFNSARYDSTNLYFPVVNWLISWGGTDRVYYLDLSAGSHDPAHDYSFRTPTHIPIQYFFSIYRRGNNETITQYVADYVSEGVRQVIFPDYSLFPPFSMTYHIMIFFFDDTGRIFDSSYERFLNASMVSSVLKRLAPYANFTVSAQFAQLRTDRRLNHQMSHSLISTTNRVGYGSSPLIVNSYDGRSIYSYLKANLFEYTGQAVNNVTIPIFCFALKSASRVVYPYQGSIVNKAPADPDGQPLGAAILTFPELSIVSISERQLFDWGLGMTHAVTQASGHMMGLGLNGRQTLADAQPSVMSLQGYAFCFSQFDIDSIQRAYADYLLSLDSEQLAAIQNISGDDIAATLLSNSTVTVNNALRFYTNLDFGTAITALGNGYSIIEQLFEQHAQWLEQQMNNIGTGSVLISMEALRLARSELGRALTTRENGQLVTSFRLLAQASVHANIAKVSEQGFSDSRLTYILTGLLAGLLVGLALMSVVVRLDRDRRKRPVDPGSMNVIATPS